ncbi:MAG TPA: hypothetical protein VLN48_22015 [Bryobacteraceae bacterium]|nr:hypothetical protein [Bryobacteraceae bacterium]
MYSRRFAFLVFALACPGFAQAPTFSQIDIMLRTVSDITGWRVQRTVPAEILSKDSFRKMVEEGVKDAETNKETRSAEIVLKMFGLVPQDFNLARESGDLLAEQAAAFYDYKKKRLFVLDSTKTDNEQLIALAHELAHALADQQHPLRKFMNDGDGDEQATARQSVIEGQATWLSWAYLSKKNGGRGEVPPTLLDRLADGTGASGADFPVFTQAPLYIRESLTFPYTEGMRFQDAVYRHLGPAAFERVFRDPPRSTQHILHPETYLASQMPTSPVVPRLEEAGAESRRFRVLAEGDVGEFDYSILLRQYIGEKEGTQAAAHWRGGTYRLYEDKQKKYPVLVHASEWDSPQAASAFFDLYQRVLRAKWKKFEIGASSPRQVTGTGDNGRFSLLLDGPSVHSIEGIQTPERVR